jgi:hypothetical protein
MDPTTQHISKSHCRSQSQSPGQNGQQHKKPHTTLHNISSRTRARVQLSILLNPNNDKNDNDDCIINPQDSTMDLDDFITQDQIFKGHGIASTGDTSIWNLDELSSIIAALDSNPDTNQDEDVITSGLDTGFNSDAYTGDMEFHHGEWDWPLDRDISQRAVCIRAPPHPHFQASPRRICKKNDLSTSNHTPIQHPFNSWPNRYFSHNHESMPLPRTPRNNLAFQSSQWAQEKHHTPDVCISDLSPQVTTLPTSFDFILSQGSHRKPSLSMVSASFPSVRTPKRKINTRLQERKRAKQQDP